MAKFKPGQSGNPGGRPKGSISLVSLIKRKLREDPAIGEEIVDNVLELARRGDKLGLNAARELLNRVDGAVTKKQEINVTGDRTKLVRLEGDEDDEEEGVEEDGE